jgi:hypothetical protein
MMCNRRAMTAGLICVAVCGWGVCGSAACGSAATVAPGSSGNQPPPGSSGEPTVWGAIDQPHAEVISLQCRGGPGFELRSLGFKAAPGGNVRVAIALTFAANTKAAGSTNQDLEPGTCAPPNRPLGPSEPREIRFLTSAFSQLMAGPVDLTATAAEYHTDVRSIADYLRSPRRYWTFTASDTHNGYFDAWVHGYWKDSGAANAGGANPGGADAGRADDLEQESTTAGWLVRVETSGGLAGSTRKLSVDADGHVQAASSATFGNVRCSAELPKTQVQSIETALSRSHPDKWLPSYALKSNPNGCCDQFTELVHVEQVDAGGRRTAFETYWFNDSAGTVPEGVKTLASLVHDDVQKACSAF